MSQDCNDPLFILTPVEGRLSEHDRERIQDQLKTRLRGSAIVIGQPMTITQVVLPTLWLVGQNRDETGERWEFQGLYDCESKAVAACRNDAYWLAPVALNQPIAEESTDWPGQYFPFAGQTETKAKPS